MIAVELVEPGTDRARRRADRRHRRRVPRRRACVVLTCGTYGNVLRFLPPLVIPDDLLDEALNVLEELRHSRGLSPRATSGRRSAR